MSGHRRLIVKNAVLDGEVVSLTALDGLITAIGPEAGSASSPGDAPATETFNAGGGILSPSLVNGHTHAAMTLFRGHGDDLPLMRWLQEAIWPVEAKLEPEDVYWGTRLACLEMIRSGKVKGIRFRTLARMCAALQCTPGELLGYEYAAEDLDGAAEAEMP